MKSIIGRFYQIIRFIVTIFASREFGFIYCVFGTIGQVTHTWFLVNNISSFSGNFQIIQALLISIFISSSLLYFVAIADNMDDSREAKKIRIAVNIFMVIEILINIYYYTRHLIIDAPEMQMFDFVFAVLVSGLLPVTIKLYGGLIRAKEWMNQSVKEEKIDENIEEEIFKKVSDFLNDYTLNIKDELKENIDLYTETSSEKTLKFEESLRENVIIKLTEFKSELLKTYDDDVSKIFQDKFNLLLQQFENKCKLIKDKILLENKTSNENS
jgi:hypothetical protein